MPLKLKHGSRATYWRHKCRCGPCRAAAKAFRAAYKPPSHGLAGYVYGCRCEFCKGAYSGYMRSWRRQRVNKGSSDGSGDL